jgi:hypothetical protein
VYIAKAAPKPGGFRRFCQQRQLISALTPCRAQESRVRPRRDIAENNGKFIASKALRSTLKGDFTKFRNRNNNELVDLPQVNKERRQSAAAVQRRKSRSRNRFVHGTWPYIY